jgi:hypothetical protein
MRLPFQALSDVDAAKIEGTTERACTQIQHQAIAR